MWVAKASMVCTATFDVASGFVNKITNVKMA
jgi:hypothetical protein